MKKNLEITDLKIGDKVAIKMPTLGGKHRLSCTMEVVTLFKDGDVYLDFDDNPGDVWEEKVENLVKINDDEYNITPTEYGLMDFSQQKYFACSLIDKVCSVFHITKKDLLSKDRSREYVDARSIVVKQLRIKLYPISSIGMYINRNHSTVINAIKQYDDLFGTDKKFTEKAKRCN